ncbi:Hypothetical_protein [Hexamita inflata]|uniref:Hypothetical_protein n=1 Tax=Hexamita inflata TaxID=28002 RepID=A0AA86QBE2_9EUKA|nr:Hypothetical protein HINF_LOCUS41516 [Hexamita inflata]
MQSLKTARQTSKLQQRQDNLDLVEKRKSRSYLNEPLKITSNKVVNLTQVKMHDKEVMCKTARLLGNMWQETESFDEEKHISYDSLRKGVHLSPPSQYPSMKLDENLFMELMVELSLE